MLKKKILFWTIALILLISIVLADDITYGNLWVEENVTSVYGLFIGKGALPFNCSDTQLLNYNNTSDIWECINQTQIAIAITDVWINETGDVMTGNLNMSGNDLTDVGTLIVTTLSLKGNLTPYTHNLYSLGSSSAWFKNIFVTNIYASIINASQITTTDLNSTNINSINIDTENLDADEGDVDNLSSNQINVGSAAKIINSSEDIVVVLQ